jgi:hypothetical protein
MLLKTTLHPVLLKKVYKGQTNYQIIQLAQNYQFFVPKYKSVVKGYNN